MCHFKETLVCWTVEGVLKGKLGVGVPPTSQNLYPIYDLPKTLMPYLWPDPKSIPCFRPVLYLVQTGVKGIGKSFCWSVLLINDEKVASY